MYVRIYKPILIVAWALYMMLAIQSQGLAKMAYEVAAIMLSSDNLYHNLLKQGSQSFVVYSVKVSYDQDEAPFGVFLKGEALNYTDGVINNQLGGFVGTLGVEYHMNLAENRVLTLSGTYGARNFNDAARIGSVYRGAIDFGQEMDWLMALGSASYEKVSANDSAKAYQMSYLSIGGMSRLFSTNGFVLLQYRYGFGSVSELVPVNYISQILSSQVGYPLGPVLARVGYEYQYITPENQPSFSQNLFYGGLVYRF